jgi:hypothetical protein
LAYNISRNEVTNKCPWEVFFGTPPIQHYYHQIEPRLWSLDDDAQAELVSAAPTLSQWQDTVEKLQQQRAELQTLVRQRHLNRAAKLREMSEAAQSPTAKLQVGMIVQVRREPPNNKGIKKRKKLEAPFREDRGVIIEIDLNSSRRYAVQFDNGEIVHVGRKWLRIIPPESTEQAQLVQSPTVSEEHNELEGTHHT